ncbi:MAG: M48 family metalloprotease [Saprospiraceae bacterium]|mgnify:CR=1 FL=1|nr:M48 family metalloprotease [Candidatus Vicinibacter affinis]
MMGSGQVQFWSDVQSSFAWMLVHSLWQGTVLVFLVLLAEKFLNARKPQLINAIYRFSLIAFLLITLGTFIYHFFIGVDIFKLSQSWWSGFSDNWVLWVNRSWAVGGFILFVRYVFSYYFLERIRWQSNAKFPDEWNRIFLQIKQNLQIRQSIVFIHSEKITSAFVTGFFKPMLVLPTSWVNNLSYEEAECVIAHELAHILAKDHLYNVICNFCELIFFFNPAAHFIIKRIRFQREICADWLTLRMIPKTLEYASLILKLGENPTFIPESDQIGFSSEKNQLCRRVKHILNINYSREKNYKTWMNMFFTFGFTLLLGYLVADREIQLPVSISGRLDWACLPENDEVATPEKKTSHKVIPTRRVTPSALKLSQTKIKKPNPNGIHPAQNINEETELLTEKSAADHLDETIVETEELEVMDTDESTHEHEVRMSEIRELARTLRQGAAETKDKVIRAMSQAIKSSGQKEQSYKIIILQNQGDLKINVSDYNTKEAGIEIN